MDAETEGDVTPCVPPEVEPVGVGEDLGVTVADVVGHDDPLTGPDDLAADLDVLDGHAAAAPVGDVEVAQQLLHRAG